MWWKFIIKDLYLGQNALLSKSCTSKSKLYRPTFVTALKCFTVFGIKQSIGRIPILPAVFFVSGQNWNSCSCTFLENTALGERAFVLYMGRPKFLCYAIFSLLVLSFRNTEDCVFWDVCCVRAGVLVFAYIRWFRYFNQHGTFILQFHFIHLRDFTNNRMIRQVFFGYNSKLFDEAIRTRR